MHQFGWLSEKGGNFLKLLQKEGVPSEKGGVSNPGLNYGLDVNLDGFIIRQEDWLGPCC